eukprot:CAMPEP_0194335844 /NCGR_PEP_ID=MMETSP0171-20130528/70958_1 /TAXON_ID=218684 /ORGANISM="Corethron pennatum, Strain L29A3" /LENGTH=452 /DNA_ID=CAMNT_0039099083 /DNA_START=93 /DNA_END=1447 /DNA_ORIENTATION=+
MATMSRNKIGRLPMLCLVLASADVASPFRPPAAATPPRWRRPTRLSSEAVAGITSSSAALSPWYADPELCRDRFAATEALSWIQRSEDDSGLPWIVDDELADGRFLLSVEGRGTFAMDEEGDGAITPLYLSYGELIKALGHDAVKGLLLDTTAGSLLLWVGKAGGLDYWAVHVPDDAAAEEDGEKGDNTWMASGGQSKGDLRTVEERVRRLRLRTDADARFDDIQTISLTPLREFGDALSQPSDAAVCAAANGLVEFHRAHRFCGTCGAPTVVARAGGARRCTDRDGGAACRGSVYPRIDAAAIMLVTSPCGEYALLGRKSFWPAGRYSTLSGFAEVGETLEGCCVRETAEESGVAVDPTTVAFVLSQPWPFPRSLMIGFRATAVQTNTEGLPKIVVQEDEMESIKWFHRDYVRTRIGGGSTAMTYEPTKEEREFHIPGKASLARILIAQWA